MELKQKIYQNIRSQMVTGIQAERLQGQLNDINRQRERLAGSMDILAELFKDETGLDLQQQINTDPEWGELIKEAEAEAQKIMVGTPEVQVPGESRPQDVSQSAQPKPKLRSVTQNKTVEAVEPEPTPAVAEGPQAVGQKDPEPPVVRGRSPVKITIDDNPPGPNTPDKPDPS